nr:retrovirus-related Pol polyprotein from transposon TNT 1-94 [Tanacetum cinerariifolium]
MFKLSVSQCVSPISMSISSYLDTFSSVRRPKHRDVIWKKKGSSNTSNVDLSVVSHLNLNKDVKRYTRKDLLSCNNSHLGETKNDVVCNDVVNVSCNSRMCAVLDDNSFFIFDDESVRISLVSKMPFRKKPYDSMNIVQICLWIIDSRCSKRMTGNRALLMNFVEKFLGTVRFGNNDFAVIAGYGDVIIGLPKMKFEKDHLCSACEQGKIHRKHYKSKTSFALNKPLYLLHMDLCGPMHVQSINGKRYVLVVVDDYSRYTWVFFLHSKDEALEVIISFIKKTQVNLQLQVQRVRTDNGTEFKNKTLAKFFDEVGISQQISAARTPQQNGVVERRNRTLVEAARTMLTFPNLPSFLWAEAIATACFTQNRLIIHKLSQVSEASRNDLEDLFQDFYDEYFDSSKIMKSLITNVKSSNVEVPSHEEEVFHEISESFQGESSSSSLNDDVQQSSEEVILPQTNTQSISINMIPNGDEASTSHNMFNERLKDAYFDATLKDIDWVSAMQEELDQFARLKVWRLVPRPEGKPVIKTKWIFKNKKDESSLVIQNKARLVSVGYSQQEGIDYDDTKQYPDHVYALDKALYGLKQAPRAWYDVLSKFLIDSGLQKVERVRTDNGTEFKNKNLAKFFDEVGITQQFSAARTPQQNGVVERRNRTLVEAARTMLTFANLPLFLWDEAIDVGKIKAKGGIRVFVGYSKESAAFRIYNKQTRKIHESVNVNFDENS